MRKIFLITIISIFNFQFSIAQDPFLPDTITPGQARLDQVMRLVDGNYTEAPDMDRLSTEAINAVLKALDPHSVYIAAKDVERANEGLNGNFEGVGVNDKLVASGILRIHV